MHCEYVADPGSYAPPRFMHETGWTDVVYTEVHAEAACLRILVQPRNGPTEIVGINPTIKGWFNHLVQDSTNPGSAK